MIPKFRREGFLLDSTDKRIGLQKISKRPKNILITVQCTVKKSKAETLLYGLAFNVKNFS